MNNYHIMATGLFDPPRNCPYGARDLHSLDCVRERAYVGLLKSFLLGYVLYEITQVQPTVFTPGFLLLFFFSCSFYFNFCIFFAFYSNFRMCIFPHFILFFVFAFAFSARALLLFLIIICTRIAAVSVCVLCAAIVVVNLILQLFAMTLNRNLNIIYLSMKNMPPAAAAAAELRLL